MGNINIGETLFYTYNSHLVLKEIIDSNTDNPIFAARGTLLRQGCTEDNASACSMIRVSGFDVEQNLNRYIVYFARHNDPKNQFAYLYEPNYVTPEYKFVAIKTNNIVCLYDNIDRKFVTSRHIVLCIPRNVVETYQLNTMTAYHNSNVMIEGIKFDTIDDLDINSFSSARRAYFYIYRNEVNTDLRDYYVIDEYTDYIIAAVDINNIVFTI